MNINHISSLPIYNLLSISRSLLAKIDVRIAGVAALALFGLVTAIVSRLREKRAQAKQPIILYPPFPEASVSHESLDHQKNNRPCFHTVQDLSQGLVGDYTYEIISEGGHTKLTILDTNGQSLSVVVRESTTHPGKYRWLFGRGKESALVFTRPQLSAIARFLRQPPKGFHLSKSSRISMGLFIFTDEKEQRWLVNSEGALQQVADVQILAFFSLLKRV